MSKIETIITIFIVLIIAGGIIYGKNFQGSAVQDAPTEEEAKWIGEHSVLYIQKGCIYCKEQEDLFGINLKYLNIVDYFEERGRQKFADAGVTQTPTWIINGQKYEEKKTIKELKELTGYQD